MLAPLGHEVTMLDDMVKRSAAAEAPTTEQHALRRSLVRAMFASIDATIWVNKQNTLRFAMGQDRLEGRSTPTFDAAEVAMLREETYDVNDRGHTKLRGARLSLCRNFKFMARTSAKVQGTSYDEAVTGRGIEVLQEAIRIRDRLTHPKVPADLEVSDRELVKVNNAWGFVIVSAAVLGGYPAEAPAGGWPWSQ